ncbi:recombinase family protein [Gluconobacter sp. P1C6_b]|uniref:recombinase family protein n=1 Tax=Gluconobacter sp. P1C6_b TaxID=2762619 RepID=UPI001C03A5E2
MGTEYAYVRVSDASQKTDPQLDWLDKQGIPPERRFIDHGENGDLLSRPALDRLLDTIRPGDWIVSYRQDRLGRDALHTLTILARIRISGAGFRDAAGINIPPAAEGVADELGFATIDHEFRAGFQAVLDQRDKRLLLAKTRAGIRAAQARGVRFGPKPKLNNDDLREAAKMRQRESRAYVAARFKVSVRTLEEHLRRFYAANPDFDPLLAVKAQRGRKMKAVTQNKS